MYLDISEMEYKTKTLMKSIALAVILEGTAKASGF